LYTVFIARVAARKIFDPMKLSFAFTLVLLARTAPQAAADNEVCEAGEACAPPTSRVLLQVGKPAKTSGLILLDSHKTCSYDLQKDQDGSKVCAHLKSGYTSGDLASLDEAGYQETAKLCCHHEMSLFVRREIEKQGFDICDLSDLHGFVHWYDCNDDTSTDNVGGGAKTFAGMQAEIAGASTNNCPWLGHLPNCPVKPENCRHHLACKPEAYPADSLPGSSAPLDAEGYAAVAKRCCHTEMEQFVRREVDRQGFHVCEEGSLQGFLNWFDCAGAHPGHDDHHDEHGFGHQNDEQTFAKLQEGLVMARSGLPPLCPWLGSVGEACPATGHNCPFVEVAEPAAHRRRTACR